jgi:ABC-2 type transport system permease protein
MQLTFTMARTLLRIFSRDRQAIIFSLFFPVLFMGVFGLVSNEEPEPVTIGIVDRADNALSAAFLNAVTANPLLRLSHGTESDLREQLVKGDLKLLLVLPEQFQDNGTPAQLGLVVDAAQVRELDLILPVLEKALVDIERSLRGEVALFSLQVEDVKARSQNYLSFLVPGLLAFTIMQLSIAGSGYNIVEYRRKGILKRLFVTPLTPQAFIGGLVLSRSLICMVQLSLLMLIAVYGFGVSIIGSALELGVVVLLGIALFLSVGFSMGSIAKTQQAIMAIGNLVTFPQMFLSGIFYPIDILPELIQPLARLLPLSFLADAVRDIVIDGAGLSDILPSLAGLLLWSVAALLLAIRLFRWKEVAV